VNYSALYLPDFTAVANSYSILQLYS